MSTQNSKVMIPTKYLSKIGEYAIKVHGSIIKVNVVDADQVDIVATHVENMIKSVISSKIQVVGLDGKTISESNKSVLILCAGNFCLVVHYNKENTIPKSIWNFLEDSRICFVTGVYSYSFYPVGSSGDKIGVEVGYLAATILQKPSGTVSSLSDIAKEVGVQYQGPTKGVEGTISLDPRYIRVLTELDVNLAVSDAVAYYRIGRLLLSSLEPLGSNSFLDTQQKIKFKKKGLRGFFSSYLPVNCCSSSSSALASR